MKHTAIINHHRATCSCGTMPGIWRRDDEAVGKFTLRAYAAWERHAAESPEDVRGSLFEFEKPKERAGTATLFG
jgi:hypothetical protein